MLISIVYYVLFNAIILKFYLGLFSLVFALFAVVYNDANKVIENGFFQGYDIVVIFLVSIQVKYCYEK